MHICSGCQRELDEGCFGKMQLKKGPGKMKCVECAKLGPEVVRKQLAEKAVQEQEEQQLAEELARGQRFLLENQSKQDVVTLASGLQYKVLENGTGKFHPTASSKCQCHYVGKLIDGSQFDSSVKGPTDGPRLIMPAIYAPEDLIPGWAEAMQLMVEGDRWELYVPPDLAYGNRGRLPKIPAGAALIFDLEISKIKGAKVERR